jgi:activator of 2-hydroxyglutaryl-CoA dehydratase
VVPDLMISGGIAKNVGVVRRLERQLELSAKVCFEPQIVGALGAALFAAELRKKQGDSHTVLRATSLPIH